MNALDLLGLLCLVAFALRGFRRGAFRECFGAIGFLAGLVAAVWLTPMLSGAFEHRSTLPSPVASAAAFILTYSGTNVLVGSVGLLLSRPDAQPSSVVLRALGSTIGAGKAIAVAGILLLAAQVLRVSPSLDSQISSSLAVRPLLTVTRSLFELRSSPAVLTSKTETP